MPERLTDPAMIPRLAFADRKRMGHFEGLATPIWVFDVDAHRMWWANRQALTFWGADSVDALIARDFSQDSETARARLRKAVDEASGGHSIRDTWTLYPDNEPRTVLVSLQAVELERARTGLLIEVNRFIEPLTDDNTWRALEAVRSTALLVSTFALDGTLLAQNPASHAHYGTRRAKPGLDSDLAARFGNPHLARQILSRVSDNEALSWEIDVRTRNGQRTHRVSARKGRDPVTGQFVAILSEEDVTELATLRRQLQSMNRELEAKFEARTEELRRSEERYELATQTAAIWDWDLKTDILFVSPNFIEQMEYDAAAFREMVSTRTLGSLVHPDDAVAYRKEVDRHLAQPQVPMSVEVRFLQKSGGFCWFQAQGQCVTDDQGVPVRSVGLLTDITRRKELETTLLASQRMEAVGQLTGGLAHDFNNLLTVVLGNVQLLEETEVLDRDLTAAITAAAQRGADLTRHLLAFARKQTLKPAPLELGGLILKMSRTIMSALGENVRVSTNVPGDLWNIYADSAQLEAAILNLALNARDAMPDGGIISIMCRNRTIDTPLAEGLAVGSGNYVEITVSDIGHGMMPETMAKAFEPFFTTKPVGDGTGLGLSMVLGFSRQSGGDTVIKSQHGAGTRVSIYLPMTTGLPVSPRAGHDQIAPHGKGEHIHIVEDNPTVQSTLVQMIRTLGYEVSSSSTPDEAMAAALSGTRPSLFLVDIILGGGQNGIDLARTLRERRPDARLILMSGYPNSHLSRGIPADLPYQFVGKPFSKERIARTIRIALGTEDWATAADALP